MKIISRVVDAPNSSTSLARLPANNQLPSIRRYRYLANMSTDRWQQAVAEHEDILIAIEAREGERLGAILKLHFDNRFSTVCEWLENNP